MVGNLQNTLSEALKDLKGLGNQAASSFTGAAPFSGAASPGGSVAAPPSSGMVPSWLKYVVGLGVVAVAAWFFLSPKKTRRRRR